MRELNVANRTLAIMDNLTFLRSLNNECVDLIEIDPPFAANETFSQRLRPPTTDSELEEQQAEGGGSCIPQKPVIKSALVPSADPELFPVSRKSTIFSKGEPMATTMECVVFCDLQGATHSKIHWADCTII